MSDTHKKVSDLSREEKQKERRERGEERPQMDTLPLLQTGLPFLMVSGTYGSCTGWRQRVRPTTSCMRHTSAPRWTFRPCSVQYKPCSSAILSWPRPTPCGTVSL